MKSICFFSYNLKIGGTEKVIVYLANYLSSLGYKITILNVSSENDLKSIINQGINLVSLNSLSIKGSVIPLIKFLRKENIDTFIANVWPLTIISSLARIFSWRTQLIFIEHCNITEEFKDKSYIFKFLQHLSFFIFYKMAHKIITVSEGVKKDLLSKGVNNSKTKVIYNPLHLKNDDIDIKEKLNVDLWTDTHEQKVICVGTLKKQKNFINLVNAIDIFYDQNDIRPKVLIVGDGNQRKDIENVIYNKGLHNDIIMAGWVVNPLPLIKQADLFVLSSDYEGFGVVIAEALSYGVTVVSTDCKSGPSEILQEGKLGYLCKVNDSEDLARKIKKGLSKPFDKELLIERSKDFSISEIGRQYELMINEE